MRTTARLTALQHPIVKVLIERHAPQITSLVEGLGSPLHLVLPQVFAARVAEFAAEFAAQNVSGQVFFAKKANKAKAFASVCAEAGIGVDVASLGELTHSLSAGVPGPLIGVSGPEKNDELLTVSLRHGCLIAVDSLGELHRLVELARRVGRAARVLLRCRSNVQPHSRFGLTEDERWSAMHLCIGNQEHIRLEGHSFHLNGYSTSERAEAADMLIDHCIEARGLGLQFCTTVNTGGGLAVQYVDSGQWARFLEHNSPTDYHADKDFDDFYPYGSDVSGVAALRAMLTTTTRSGDTLAERAARAGLNFIIEPGRALLADAGLTLFTVQGVKFREPDGYAIVTVTGSSFSMSEQWFNSDYLPDPLLWPAADARTVCDPEGFRVSVGGATCLEADMVTWRKVALHRPVERGDHLVYLNTAGYQMDSNESPFHEAPLPLKVVVDTGDDHTLFRWRLDRHDR